jgi:hypothetical protein
MSDRTDNGDRGNGSSGSSGTAKALKRYGPFVAIAVIVAIIAIVAGGGGDDDGEDVTAGNGNGNGAASELPTTFAEAQESGDDVDFGPNCDEETGRIKIPANTAAPCVEVWDGTDNGGATAPGVTADAIKVAVYVGQNDPLQEALVSGAGASTDPKDYYQTAVDYLRGYERMYQTYGRKLDIVAVNATGGPADEAAARADAIKIVQEIKPFAVLGGPSQTSAFWEEVAKAEIMCIGTCTVAESQERINAAAPYVWPQGPAPEQADANWIEMLEKQVAGGKAEYAGDESMHDQDRVFGFIGAETEQGEFAERHDNIRAELAERGIDVVESQAYVFDPAQGQEIARTAINKMKSAGVTTILITADPLIPKNLTEEATAQEYFPEWVLGPSVYMDTTLFGRTFDQEQWSHAFGYSVLTARVPREKSESYLVYKWFNDGKEPPVNAQGIPFVSAYYFMTGIHLAGPNLTPETFAEGMFRYGTGAAEPERSGIVEAHTTWGTDVWEDVLPEPDYNGSDDGTMIWWDPDAPNDIEDETGNKGSAAASGAYRYVNGGQRYLPGDWPEEKVNFFDPEGTIFLYDERPEVDAVPDYPPPK